VHATHSSLLLVLQHPLTTSGHASLSKHKFTFTSPTGIICPKFPAKENHTKQAQLLTKLPDLKKRHCVVHPTPACSETFHCSTWCVSRELLVFPSCRVLNVVSHQQ
jgi:hypothetical protein